MARKELAMEAKLLAVLTSETSVPVAQLCRELGISRQSFYKYRRRFAAEGPAGLIERSRRPKRSPKLMSAALEDEIVRLRKELPLDRGPRTIAFHLERSGQPVPSVSAIYRALVRRGMVIAEPHKAPKSIRRFEFDLPNGAWQIDATQWALRSGRRVWIMDVLDDHSRLLVAAIACWGPTAEAAWEALCSGMDRWGVPARVMSDNGVCFTARFTQPTGESAFDRDLRALGVTHICSSPSHPQTCGKIERHHQTLKAWLSTRPAARTLAGLQRLLDEYERFYNHERPHSAKAGATPVEAWRANQPDKPGPSIALPSNAGLRRVNSTGTFMWNGFNVGLGHRHKHKQVLVIARDLDLAVFDEHRLLRRLTIDPTRSYQPTGRPPGRPPKQPT